MYLKTIIAALAVGLFPSLLMSQSMPTAVRRLNVQVGGLFSVANPGVASDATIVYGQMNFKGGGMYATIDPANHLGLEMSVRQVFGTEGVHERTYSAGPRFYLTRGRFMPYGKVLFGRAVFNFPNNFANQAFTEGSLGGGVDYRLTSLLYVRADYDNHSPPQCISCGGSTAGHRAVVPSPPNGSKLGSRVEYTSTPGGQYRRSAS